MGKNIMRDKEYQYSIVADEIDALRRSMELTSNYVTAIEEELTNGAEDWVKQQRDDQLRKLLAYDAVIAYLEKFN